jgi:hypothetical protein
MKLNCASGQRPFGKGWTNVDTQEKWREASDKAGGRFLCADIRNLRQSSWENAAEMIVIHHGLEHLGFEDAARFVADAHWMLRSGGSLLVFVPNMRALATRWLTRQMETDLYMTNVYGAYMGDPADRHKCGWDERSLVQFLSGAAPWSCVKRFDREPIEGADIAAWDWWILDMEVIK